MNAEPIANKAELSSIDFAVLKLLQNNPDQSHWCCLGRDLAQRAANISLALKYSFKTAFLCICPIHKFGQHTVAATKLSYRLNYQS